MALSDRLSPYQPYALAFMRIVTGLQFMEHGTQKLFSFPVGTGHPLDAMGIIEGLLEFVGGLLITLGLLTRPVAFLLSGEMAVAYFTAHMPRNFFPVMNGGDAAISFCLIFLFIFFAGPGRFAVDNLRK